LIRTEDPCVNSQLYKYINLAEMLDEADEKFSAVCSSGFDTLIIDILGEPVLSNEGSKRQIIDHNYTLVYLHFYITGYRVSSYYII
jgi:hypothetical protein